MKKHEETDLCHGFLIDSAVHQIDDRIYSAHYHAFAATRHQFRGVLAYRFMMHSLVEYDRHLRTCYIA